MLKKDERGGDSGSENEWARVRREGKGKSNYKLHINFLSPGDSN